MKSPEKNLEQWIEGCKEGNRRSQEMVYELYFGKMMGICYRYAKNKEEAKDLLQEGFLKVFKNIHKYNKQGSFEGWIKRIIVNNAIDHLRKGKNTFYLEDSYETLSDVSEVDDSSDEKTFFNLKAEDVIDAMQKLSPAYRTVFNLYVMENYTHKEIADFLNISVGTSKSNLAKAKGNLKSILQKEYISKL